MNSQYPQKFEIKWKDHVLNLNGRTHIMGILNVTPDSFADGGLYFSHEKAIAHALEMERDGADIIDVGGESTRPYSQKVSLEEELHRVIPVIDGLNNKIKVPISIDTYRAEVARQALKAGASIINDISALNFDPDMVSVASEAECPIILMHIKGTPENMQRNPQYDDLINEIIEFLKTSINKALRGGIDKGKIIVDPGIGFGKTFDHNLQIIRDLDRFTPLGMPILFGSSRKAFIGHILCNEPPFRDTGTMATICVGIMKGAHIVRVHNVKMAVETVKLMDAIKRGAV